MTEEHRIGYARKSSEGEDRQAGSLSQQHAQIEKAFGEIPSHLWFDDQVSGMTFQRPAFRRLIEYCKANPQPDDAPGKVCVFDISRFGRIVDKRSGEPDVDAMEFVRLTLKQLGWHLAFVHGPNTGHLVGDAVVRTLESEAAGRYSVLLSEKVLLGKRDWSTRGWWPGGSAPFGARRFNICPAANPR